MPRLFWLQPDTTIVEFPLRAEQSLIGRSSRCDVRIKHPAVSAEHALIRLVGDMATIEDLGSSNGTRVNGRRIDSVVPLRHGDQIEVGRERLIYFADLDLASRTMHQTEASPLAQPAARGESVKGPRTTVHVPLSALEQPLSASVCVLTGPAQGQVYPLVQEVTSLGKVGRQVIEIRRFPGPSWRLSQREGAIAVTVNGEPVIGERELVSGDVIEMTGVQLRFEISLARAHDSKPT
ncbi:MAG: FHA domain-containing protein [Casimicrobiaceae bacterium]|nr:FHA domain-containing protein [Casimicrobiaceae bacterium]